MFVAMKNYVVVYLGSSKLKENPMLLKLCVVNWKKKTHSNKQTKFENKLTEFLRLKPRVLIIAPYGQTL